MKVHFTEAALRDLNQIFEYIALNYPTLTGPLEQRINSVLARLEQWPESARRVTQRSDVRVAPLIRYPYRIFYRITSDTIEIVHIRHTSQRPLWDEC